MTKLYTFALCTLIIFSQCRTAKKSYQHGNYADAIERGVKKLQKDPSDGATMDLVQRSYNNAVNEHEDQITILSHSKNENRFEKIYQEYSMLQRLYETIHQYPAVASMIRTKDYADFVYTYREKSATVHVERANRWLNEGTKRSYREAYKELTIAFNYTPDDFELKQKRDEVYESALTKVMLAQINNNGAYYQLQHFQQEILQTLRSNMNNDFVKFYNSFEARNMDIIPDQVLVLDLNRINVGQPYDNHQSREVSKEVVVKEIVYRPDSVVKQYGTVRARITTTKRTLISQADLYITVRDTRGGTVWNDRLTGERKWETSFANYTGDERALSESDKALLNQNQNQPPSEDHILDELLRQLQNDLTYRLRNYYSGYQ